MRRQQVVLIALATCATVFLPPAGRSAPAMLRGQLVVDAVDPVEAGSNSPFGSAAVLYYLQTAHGRVRLHSTASLTKVKPRSTIEVSESALATSASGTPETVEVVAPPPFAPLSIHHLLVIDLVWSGAKLKSSQTTVSNVIFGTSDPSRRSLKQYYDDVSYGQLDWTGDVTPTLTIPKQDCSAANADFLLTDIADAGTAAAATAGYDISSYDNIMFNVPAPCLGGYSIGDIGGPFTWLDNTLWSLADGWSREAAAHELGHNLGLAHAHGLDCGKVSISQACLTNALANDTRCDTGTGTSSPCLSEYGNPYEVMGNNWPGDNTDGVAWPSVPSLVQLGWFDGRYTTLTDPGEIGASSYTLSPLELESPSGPQALEIDSASGSYFVELRAAIRQDSFLSHFSAGTSGVIVTLAASDLGLENGAMALDMTPNSNSSCKYCDFYDEPLRPGAAFVSDDGSFILTVPKLVRGVSAIVEVAWHTSGLAQVSSFMPDGGPSGTTVTISGSGFTGATDVRFGNTPVQNFTVDSDTQITATVPLGARTGPIAVAGITRAGQSSASFHYLGITSFTPSHGKAGAIVTVSGSGFTGTTAVKVGDVNAQSFTVKNDSKITMAVAAGTITGPITVTAPDGTAASNANLTMVPQIVSLAPVSGPVGTTVTITGSGFTGTTSVRFAGVPADNYTVDSDTQITATVRASTRTGPITISVPGVTTTSTAKFRVLALVNFSPSHGKAGTSVSITGSGFTAATHVSFAGTDAKNFKVLSDTRIIAVVAPATATGPISVTTAYGTTTSATNFVIG